MKKSVVFMFGVCFAFSLSTAEDTIDLFSYIPFKSAVWQSKITITGQDKPMVMEQTIYYKNRKMRTEGVRSGGQQGGDQKFVTIVDGVYIYSFDPEAKQGMKMKMKDDGSNMEQAGSDFALNKCRKTAVKSGAEKVNGVPCDIYVYKCTVGKQDMSIKEWRSKEGFPVKTESILGGFKTLTETFELKPNADVPDSKFSVTGLNLMDMDQVMHGGMMMRQSTKDMDAEPDAEIEVSDEEESELEE